MQAELKTTNRPSPTPARPPATAPSTRSSPKPSQQKAKVQNPTQALVALMSQVLPLPQPGDTNPFLKPLL